jgi:hypothetical protein
MIVKPLGSQNVVYLRSGFRDARVREPKGEEWPTLGNFPLAGVWFDVSSLLRMARSIRVRCRCRSVIKASAGWRHKTVGELRIFQSFHLPRLLPVASGSVTALSAGVRSQWLPSLLFRCPFNSGEAFFTTIFLSVRSGLINYRFIYFENSINWYSHIVAVTV